MLATTGSASAAAVDIRFELNPGEGGCHPWSGRTSDQVQWNLTLRMNGTDTTAQTTPTYVYIEDHNIPARQDGWIFLLTAGQPAPPAAPAYDDSSGETNTQSFGDGAFPPPVKGKTLELALYGEARQPVGASPATVTVLLTPSLKSLNKDWFFNITAHTDRTGVSNITRKVQLCVNIPQDPFYTMGNFTYNQTPTFPPIFEISAAGNSSLEVYFWIRNTGNTEDRYICTVFVPRADWTWVFLQGFQFSNATHGRTNYTQPGQNLSQENSKIVVRVYVPPTARAQENSTVSLDCESEKLKTMGGGLNESRKPFPPYTRVSVVQYYWVCGDEVGPTLLEGIPGDDLTFRFSVYNQGNGPDRGEAYMWSGDTAWSTLITPDTWDLRTPPDPGFNGTGEFRVSIPEETPIATYEYQINITSSTPGTPTCPLRYKISVLQEFIPTIVVSAPQKGSLGQEVVFNFRISNEGNGLDSLRVQLFNLSDWRVFLDPPVGEKILTPHEFADFTVTVIVPRETAKAQVGMYNTTVVITSVYATDYGLSVSVSGNLSVIIDPRVECTMDPTITDKDFNPYAAPGQVSEANFILSVTNRGNGGDGVTLQAEAPQGITVTLAPSSLNLKIAEFKAVLVTLRANASLTPGIYSVNITATSILNASSTCKSTYRVTIFNLDGALNENVQLFVQDPAKPNDEPQVSVLPVVTQIDGYYVRFRLIVENRGDRALAIGTVTVTLTDELLCERAPSNAGNDTCGKRTLTTWTLPLNLTAGSLGSATTMEYRYDAPDYLCITDPVLCESKTNPPPNAHKLTFTLTMSAESNAANNEASVIVNVLPFDVIREPDPPAPLPIAAIAAAGAVAAVVGFVVWYRFLRPPKVDEELYASIYGGNAAPGAPPPPPPGQDGIDAYFQSQQQPGQVPEQYQGMSDQQVEEARKLYGDSYGKRR
jgi:uncharacterized membrane protein